MVKDKDPTPWGDFPDLWPSKARWFTWLRGVLRRGWNNSPVKIKFLQKHRYKIPNPNPKGRRKEVWGADCNICKNTFPMKGVQVDHKIPAGILNDFSDIESFVVNLLAVGEDDLQLLCKGCHEVITHSQKLNCSFEEARIDKARIRFENKPVAWQKKILAEYGVLDASNKEKRSIAIRELLSKGVIKVEAILC